MQVNITVGTRQKMRAKNLRKMSYYAQKQKQQMRAEDFRWPSSEEM